MLHLMAINWMYLRNFGSRTVRPLWAKRKKKPSGAMDKQYEKVAEAAMADLEGGMCWPVEWFKEDLLEPQEMWGDVDGTWILENRIC